MTLDGLNADLESHHIEGIAREGGVPFSCPLVSHVQGRLWQGGCLNGVQLPDRFKYVISLYPWERYRLPRGAERKEFRLYDTSAGEIPGEQFYAAAQLVNGFLAKDDGDVLVHCQAGLNRSALVAGLALVLNGMQPAEAIALLRERRSPAVLCNKAFEQWLLSQTADTAAPPQPKGKSR